MANSIIASPATRSRTSRCAHVIERIGLAMAGASCGLFVAAQVASTRIEELSSVALVFALMVLGAIGFYLGIDVPPHRSGRASLARAANFAGEDPPPTDPVELLSSAGTFLAALAALVSVYIIVFADTPDTYWTLGLTFCWLFGALLQIAAGITARVLHAPRA
ncbi:MAG: hypothetical protein ACRC9K_22245 [Afipia sp.]